MCYRHLQAHTEVVSRWIADTGTHDLSRESASKRPRLDTNDQASQEYYDCITEELGSIMHRPGTWGERTDTLLAKILARSRLATSDGSEQEVLYLSGEAAGQRLELGTIETPIVTTGQQPFRWADGARPIEQFLRWMVYLDQDVSVQKTTRSVKTPSCEVEKLRAVQGRFIPGQPSDDPWNCLDLYSPLPATLPLFLNGENCQLLSQIRDGFLGGSAGRIEAPASQWNRWRHVLEWGLLAEGGHNTGPHRDSHGFSTWLTVQEGCILFGWLSRPSATELAA
jgi:hypothetical protein